MAALVNQTPPAHDTTQTRVKPISSFSQSRKIPSLELYPPFFPRGFPEKPAKYFPRFRMPPESALQNENAIAKQFFRFFRGLRFKTYDMACICKLLDLLELFSQERFCKQDPTDSPPISVRLRVTETLLGK